MVNLAPLVQNLIRKIWPQRERLVSEDMILGGSNPGMPLQNDNSKLFRPSSGIGTGSGCQTTAGRGDAIITENEDEGFNSPASSHTMLQSETCNNSHGSLQQQSMLQRNIFFMPELASPNFTKKPNIVGGSSKPESKPTFNWHTALYDDAQEKLDKEVLNVVAESELANQKPAPEEQQTQFDWLAEQAEPTEAEREAIENVLSTPPPFYSPTFSPAEIISEMGSANSGLSKNSRNQLSSQPKLETGNLNWLNQKQSEMETVTTQSSSKSQPLPTMKKSTSSSVRTNSAGGSTTIIVEEYEPPSPTFKGCNKGNGEVKTAKATTGPDSLKSPTSLTSFNYDQVSSTWSRGLGEEWPTARTQGATGKPRKLTESPDPMIRAYESVMMKMPNATNEVSNDQPNGQQQNLVTCQPLAFMFPTEAVNADELANGKPKTTSTINGSLLLSPPPLTLQRSRRQSVLQSSSVIPGIVDETGIYDFGNRCCNSKTPSLSMCCCDVKRPLKIVLCCSGVVAMLGLLVCGLIFYFFEFKL